MGCKSAAKSKLKEETVASSSSSSSLSFSKYNQPIQSPAKAIQEQGVEHDGKSSLGDEEESEEGNAAARVSSEKSLSLRGSSGTSGGITR